MRAYITLLFLVCFMENCYSQEGIIRNSQADSLQTKLATDSAYIFRKTKAKLYLRVENRRSFISQESINLFGFLAGVTLFEKHILCAGYYGMDKRSKKAIDIIDNARYVNQYLNLNYYNFAYQYIIFNKRYVQLNAPVEVGLGRYRIRVTDSLDRPIRHLSGDFVPINAGLLCILKPVKWAGISLLGGYRYVRDEQIRQIKLNFRGWYYSIGIWIDARQLLRNGNYYLRKRKYHRDLHALGF